MKISAKVWPSGFALLSLDNGKALRIMLVDATAKLLGLTIPAVGEDAIEKDIDPSKLKAEGKKFLSAYNDTSDKKYWKLGDAIGDGPVYGDDIKF